MKLNHEYIGKNYHSQICLINRHNSRKKICEPDFFHNPVYNGKQFPYPDCCRYKKRGPICHLTISAYRKTITTALRCEIYTFGTHDIIIIWHNSALVPESLAMHTTHLIEGALGFVIWFVVIVFSLHTLFSWYISPHLPWPHRDNYGQYICQCTNNGWRQ